MTAKGDSGSIDRDVSAHVLYDAWVREGWDKAEAAALWRRVQRLAFGLPAEDEFCLILSWLGQCRVVHRLDQLGFPPEASGRYRIPDLLAVMDYKGRDVPVLIEVKTSTAPFLSWKPDFIDGLRRYASSVGVPLLIAWKPTVLSAWTLVDVDRFQIARTNSRLSWQTAMMGNLLGELAGDFAVMFAGNTGMHFEFQSEKSLRRWEGEHGPVEEAIFRVTDAYFTNTHGDRLTSMSHGLWALFLAAQQEDFLDVYGDKYRQHFVIPPNQFGTWAHQTLVTMLAFRYGTEQGMDPGTWYRLLRRHTFPFSVNELRDEADAGFGLGITQYVFDITPDVMPQFLQNSSRV